MHDASSLRYQHRRNVLARQIRECEATANAARAIVAEIDARSVPANETQHDMLVRLVSRETAVLLIAEMERRITWAQIGRRALEAELRAIWAL